MRSNYTGSIKYESYGVLWADVASSGINSLRAWSVLSDHGWIIAT